MYYCCSSLQKLIPSYTNLPISLTTNPTKMSERSTTLPVSDSLMSNATLRLLYFSGEEQTLKPRSKRSAPSRLQKFETLQSKHRKRPCHQPTISNHIQTSDVEIVTIKPSRPKGARLVHGIHPREHNIEDPTSLPTYIIHTKIKCILMKQTIKTLVRSFPMLRSLL